MGAYSSTAANGYADKIKAVYEYLDEIKKVADRLTPVEDLTSFQTQIEALYAQLDVLVEASNLISSATPTGQAILTGTVESIKLLLGVGSLPEDVVRQAALDVALADLEARINGQLTPISNQVGGFQSTLNQLEALAQNQQTLISGLQVNYQNLQTGQATAQANYETVLTRLSAQEQGMVLTDQRLSTINQSLADTTTGLQAVNGVVSGHTASISTLGNATQINANSINQLSSDLVDTKNNVAAHTSALDSMETSILGLGEDMVAQSNATTALKSAIAGSGNLLPNPDFVMGASGWQITVAEEDWASTVLTVDTFNMPPEVHCLEVLGTPSPLGKIVVQSPAVLVEPNQYYVISGYPGVDNGTISLSYKIFNAAGQVLDQGACPPTFNTTTNPNIASYTRTWIKPLAPTGAATLRLYLTVTGDGDYITQGALFRPMVERGWAEQTEPGAWTTNGMGVQDLLATAVQTLDTEVSDINGELTTLAAQQTTLTSRLDGVEIIAEDAKNDAEDAKAQADAAKAQAAASMSALLDLTSDAIISVSEKPQLIMEVKRILMEQPGIVAQADAAEIVAERDVYNTRVTELVTYLDTLTTPYRWDDLNGPTNIT